RATARRVVAQHRGGLRLLLFLDLGVGRGLGRVQRSGRPRRRGARRCSRGFGRLLLGFLALALLLFAQLVRLELAELLLALGFLLAQLDLFLIEGRRGRRRWRRRFGSNRGRGDLVRVALHEHALLAHLHLHRAVLAGGVGL